MPYTQHAPAPVVDQRQSNWVDSYQVVVPNDGAVHLLSEIGFGYFTGADPAGSDRALRSVMIRNIETAAARTVMVGGDGVRGRVAGGTLNPGEAIELAVDKLSSVGVLNAGGANVTIEVLLLDVDV